MMTLINLTPEVVEFLETNSHIHIDETGQVMYIVNNNLYMPTDEEGVFSVTYLEQPPEEDTVIN
jgi:hypothetical protein